jgi:hypothetical protein
MLNLRSNTLYPYPVLRHALFDLIELEQNTTRTTKGPSRLSDKDFLSRAKQRNGEAPETGQAVPVFEGR